MARSGGISRRSVLKAGALGAFGLTWPGLLRSQSADSSSPAAQSGSGRARAKSVIFVYLDGGMSHIDTLDMKPAAAPEYRGEFQPIASTIPGVPICEHLPRMARILGHCALVRSMGQRGRGIIGD